MRELLTFVAQSLVDHPDQVVVRETEGPEAVILELSVAEDDMGKVIGKQGAGLDSPSARWSPLRLPRTASLFLSKFTSRKTTKLRTERRRGSSDVSTPLLDFAAAVPLHKHARTVCNRAQLNRAKGQGRNSLVRSRGKAPCGVQRQRLWWKGYYR